MLYGYLVSEVPLPPIPKIKESAKISDFYGAYDASRRSPVAVSLGCPVVGIVPPKPDLDNRYNARAGAEKRFLTSLPVPVPSLREEFREFVRRKIPENFVPLDPTVDTSVPSWLDKCPYPDSRKQELLRVWEECGGVIDQKRRRVKSFIKDEFYVDYKYPRPINSRSDAFKCRVGPVFRLIEEVVYKHPVFIKHIPVEDRPQYIMDMLYADGSSFGASDYTSFEAMFDQELMNICEMELYRYMTQHIDDQGWYGEVKRTLTGKNVCLFKTFRTEVAATRMSGEMCTSLGNGFTNWMLCEFVCWKKGSRLTIVVEGDDGLFRVDGPKPTREDFTKLGADIKLESHTKLEYASFCGVVFDVNDKINVTDPLYAMSTFGWGSRTYLRSNNRKLMMLLRCKALSLAHQYPGCPILGSLAQYGLRVTRSYDVRHYVMQSRHINEWERVQLISALKAEKRIMKVEPPMATRLLVQSLYGIPVSDQINIEHYFDSLDTLQPLVIGVAEVLCPRSWLYMANNYVRKVSRFDELDHPTFPVFPMFRKSYSYCAGS